MNACPSVTGVSDNDTLAPEICEPDRESWEHWRLKDIAFSKRSCQLIALGTKLICFERATPWIDDPIVLNARGRVSAHLDAPITARRAGRQHFYCEVGSAFECHDPR